MKHIIREKIDTPAKVAERITKRLLSPLDSTTCLHGEEDAALDKATLLLDGSHDCTDGTDGKGNVDDTGTCMVCGANDLL